MVTVIVGVMFTCFFRMVSGMDAVAVGHVRVVTGLVMIAGLVMLSRLAVMRSGLLMVFGRFAVMFCC